MAYSELPGVILLSIAAVVSLLAVVIYFLTPSFRLRNYKNTHINGYFRSLLFANAIQAFGTSLNIKWAAERGVDDSSLLCGAQGGIKQAGNIATALWYLVLSVHLFNLLFRRTQATRVGFWATIICGWTLVVFVVIIGPLAIQRPEKGPYFGISGAWCWITEEYPKEQIFLEYFLEYISAGTCFFLYTAIILRMRGDLVRENNRWKLRFLPKQEEAWMVSLRRDLIDYTMLDAVQHMVWFPVMYSIILIPISLARLSSFAGANVPYWLTIICAIIFNITGLANVLLLHAKRRFFPDTQQLPLSFGTARPAPARMSLFVRGGITPFTLERSETAEQYHVERLARADSMSTIHSTEKIDDLDEKSKEDKEQAPTQ
ncbi:Git3 domain-containing protein [Mycena kentingensis (nom. inval.)]|nr:Git3 domain-containing protein [Mycena kentingensis (nom. inval.)]